MLDFRTYVGTALLCAAVSPLATVYAQSMLDKSGWQLQFNDDFNYATSQLSTNWDFTYSSTSNNIPATCATNNAYNSPTNAYQNAYTLNGELHLRMLVQAATDPNTGISYNYTSPTLRSARSTTTRVSGDSCGSGLSAVMLDGFRYGMFEIRCKMPAAGKTRSYFAVNNTSGATSFDVFQHFNQRQSYQYKNATHWSVNSQWATVNSTTSMTIGSGTRTFTLSNPSQWKSIAVGQTLVLKANVANPATACHYMKGTVQSFNPTTGVCTITVGTESTNNCAYTWGVGSNSTDWAAGYNSTPPCNFNGGSLTYSSWRVSCDKNDCVCTTPNTLESATTLVYEALRDDYHTYTLVWTPTQISYFFDGVETRTDTTADRLDFYNLLCQERTTKMVLGMTLDLTCGESFSNPTAGEMVVDYVRVYKPTSSNSSYNFRNFSGKSPINQATLVASNFKVALSTNKDMAVYVPTANALYYIDNANRLRSTAGFASTNSDVQNDLEYDPINQRIYYYSTAGALKYFNIGNTTSVNTNATNCAGNIVVDKQIGKVYYMNTSGVLWNYYFDGSTWVHYPLLTPNPALIGNGDFAPNNDVIYYHAVGNGIAKITWNGSTWVNSGYIATGLDIAGSGMGSNNLTRLLLNASKDRLFYMSETYSTPLYGTAYGYSILQLTNLTGTPVQSYVNPLNPALPSTATNGLMSYDATRDALFFGNVYPSYNQAGFFFRDNDANSYVWKRTRLDTSDTYNGTTISGVWAGTNAYYIGRGSSIYAYTWNTAAPVLRQCDGSNPNGIAVYRPAMPTDDAQTEVRATIGDHALTVYPNPTHGAVRIALSLVDDATVTLQVADLNGRIVRQVATDRALNKGEHTFDVDASDLAAGVYFYYCTVGGQVIQGKLMKH